MMKSIFELAEIQLINPFKNQKPKAVHPNTLEQTKIGSFPLCSVMIHCPQCRYGFNIPIQVAGSKSYAETPTENAGNSERAMKKQSDLTPGLSNFEIQMPILCQSQLAKQKRNLSPNSTKKT